MGCQLQSKEGLATCKMTHCTDEHKVQKPLKSQRIYILTRDDLRFILATTPRSSFVFDQQAAWNPLCSYD